ncbi:MAG: D-2-hydroxyacid dehydrogenase family protein [Limnohabitans sp.]|nr:D-2-hydroxyacid dehydrogenase family protein [Limnohabitans sp.]
MSRLAILDDFQGVALDMADWRELEGRVEITVFHEAELNFEKLVERLLPFDFISTVRERTPFPRQLIDRLPRLRLLATTGMFNRSFDLVALGERKITVCGTTSSWVSTSEMTWALILALAKNVHLENLAMRNGQWQTTIGAGLEGKRLGIIGLGKIGAHVARIAQAFHMEVVAWSRNLNEARCKEVGVRLVNRAELFSSSDFISLHYVLTESTRYLITANDFEMMKPSAFFVNTSRGQLIDEMALVDVLRRHAIAGAGLDVYETEPLLPDHPLLQLSNVVLTPHLGYVTHEQFATYYTQTIENILAFLDGNLIRLLRTPPT